MNRLSLTILLLIAYSFIIYGQSQTRKSGRGVEQQLIQLENDWLAADARQDKSTIERLIAADWIGTTSHGKVMNRAEMLAETMSLKTDTVGTISDTRVRVIGNAAIVTGLLTTKAATGDAELTLRKRFTDVWLNRKTGWQCIASHGSNVQ